MIVFGVVMVFVQTVMSKDGGIRFVFKTHSLYGQNSQSAGGTVFEFGSGLDMVSNVTLDDINGVDNTADANDNPHFMATSGSLMEQLDDANLLVLNDSLFPWDKTKDSVIVSYSDFKAAVLGKGLLTARKGVELTPVELKPENLHLVLVEYTPVTASYKKDGVVKTKNVTAMIDATDSFGNRILDDDGNIVKSEQVIYNEVVYNESGAAGGKGEGSKSLSWVNKGDVSQDDNFDYEIVDADAYEDLNLSVTKQYRLWGDDATNSFVLDQNNPHKYKLIVRYDDGKGLKCEFTALFKNKVRTEYYKYYEEDKP